MSPMDTNIHAKSAKALADAAVDLGFDVMLETECSEVVVVIVQRLRSDGDCQKHMTIRPFTDSALAVEVYLDTVLLVNADRWDA